MSTAHSVERAGVQHEGGAATRYVPTHEHKLLLSWCLSEVHRALAAPVQCLAPGDSPVSKQLDVLALAVSVPLCAQRLAAVMHTCLRRHALTLAEACSRATLACLAPGAAGSMAHPYATVPAADDGGESLASLRHALRVHGQQGARELASAGPATGATVAAAAPPQQAMAPTKGAIFR